VASIDVKTKTHQVMLATRRRIRVQRRSFAEIETELGVWASEEVGERWRVGVNHVVLGWKGLRFV
jgi:hypothetical protein